MIGLTHAGGSIRVGSILRVTGWSGTNVMAEMAARWVEDGKFWTSSGVSAGIDMALAVIARLSGLELAEQIAVLMEYEWHRDAGNDPFAAIHKLV